MRKTVVIQQDAYKLVEFLSAMSVVERTAGMFSSMADNNDWSGYTWCDHFKAELRVGVVVNGTPYKGCIEFWSENGLELLLSFGETDDRLDSMVVCLTTSSPQEVEVYNFYGVDGKFYQDAYDALAAPLRPI